MRFCDTVGPLCMCVYCPSSRCRELVLAHHLKWRNSKSSWAATGLIIFCQAPTLQLDESALFVSFALFIEMLQKPSAHLCSPNSGIHSVWSWLIIALAPWCHGCYKKGVNGGGKLVQINQLINEPTNEYHQITRLYHELFHCYSCS